MFDEQACEKALENLRILERKDNFKKWGGQVAPQINCDVVEQLIKEHFESKEDTLEFKNFKLHADGTLKSMSKDELISYIHMLHHNWNVSDEQLFNVIEKNNTLQNEVDYYKHEYYSMCDLYENPQPYKFEDLKELIGKPIFDYKYKEFYILAEVKEEELYKDEGLEKFMICSDKKGLMRVFFEEGRFFPIIKALEYQK